MAGPFYQGKRKQSTLYNWGSGFRYRCAAVAPMDFKVAREIVQNTRAESLKSHMKEIKTIESRVVYENKWMRVREDRIRRPSGAEGIYGVVDKPDFVAILPIDNYKIHLVEQYRYPVERRFWEIPQGSWEDDPKADSRTVAAGELQEETGLISGTIVYIGHLFQAYGYSNQGFHLFLASDFEQSEQCLDQEEEGLVSECFSLPEFESMIISGTIKDATTISAYGFARLKGYV